MKKQEWLNLFGENLKKLMDEKNITAAELAEKTNLSRATISKYINKKQSPKPKAIINLSIVLGISIQDLIGFTDRIDI